MCVDICAVLGMCLQRVDLIGLVKQKSSGVPIKFSKLLALVVHPFGGLSM